MKILITALLVLLAQQAAAQQVLCPSNPKPANATDAQLCWVNAGKDVNGNKLPASGPYSLIDTRIQRVTMNKAAACNFDKVTQYVTVKPNVLARLYTGLPKDTKQCFRSRHMSHDKNGKELHGAWSQTVCKITTKGQSCKVTAAAKKPAAAEAQPQGMSQVY